MVQNVEILRSSNSWKYPDWSRSLKLWNRQDFKNSGIVKKVKKIWNGLEYKNSTMVKNVEISK